MDVDIDLPGGQRDKKDSCRANVALTVRTRFAKRSCNRRRCGWAAVDENILVATRRSGLVWALNESGYGNAAGSVLAHDRQQCVGGVGAEKLPHPFFGRCGRGQPVALMAVDRQ